MSEKKNTSEGIRLQRFISEAGVCSRRKAEQLILDGKVAVNGRVVTELGTKVTSDDSVKVQGRRVVLEKKVLYLFHKPKNVVTSLRDPEGRPCIGDYVADLDARVFPVGRLDYDASGLVILTNDGDFAEKLMHPRFQVEREYVVLMRGELEERDRARLLKGIRLDDGRGRFKEIIDDIATEPWRRHIPIPKPGQSVVRVVVTEGRNHFVKRMFLAVGKPVRGLFRVRVAKFNLGKIRSGQMLQVDKYQAFT